MEAIVNGQTIKLSEAGWLENLDEWSEELAVEIARNENIGELTDEHWDIINTAREYFQDNGVVCEPRQFSKIMKEKYGKESHQVRQQDCRPAAAQGLQLIGSGLFRS